MRLDKYIAVCFLELCNTLPNYDDSTPVCKTGRKAMKVEVGFSH